MPLKGVSLSDMLSLSSLSHRGERKRTTVGRCWWEVAEDGDGGGVFESRCRWLVGVQSMFV
ncbi:hypothetical protein Hanom_Chr00s031003g01770001 [Helianthus anomalus]